MNIVRKISVIVAAAICIVVTACSVKTVEVPFDSNVKDYTPVVVEILKSHPKGNVRICFGKGLYPFYPEQGTREFLTLSNNDSGDKRIAFLIKDMRNVTIEGAGSDFMFHGSMVPFAVKESSNVTIKGVSVDYDYPWTFEGTVLSSDPASRSFTVKVFPDTKYRIEGDRLFFGGYDWEYPMGESILFDPKTHRPFFDTCAYDHGYWSGEMGARDLGDGVVEFTRLSARDVPPVGSVWDDKGPTGLNRRFPAMAVLSSKNINIENVHIYRSGGMGLIAEYSENIWVKGFSTAAHEGSPRMVTTSADATHFVSCNGKITIEDSLFESMLDDAANIHGIYMLVDSVLSVNTLRAHFGHFQQVGNQFADAGDKISFVDKSNLRPIGSGVIKSIDKSDRKAYLIEMDFDLTRIENPTNIALENISRGADVTIRNCTVRYNRARSLLLSTYGDVLVEDCDFASQMAGICVSGDANFWYESGRTKDIVIRNNKFTDLAIGANGPQAILQIDPEIPTKTRGNDFHYHNRVVFSGNTVSTFDSQIVYARSVGTLDISDNIFIDSKSYAPLFPRQPVIDVQFCGDVTIKDNDFSKWKPDAEISVHDCVKVENDSGLPVIDKPNPYRERNW